MTHVTAATATVIASPGPNERNSRVGATDSAAQPAATVSPATSTIGAVSATARRDATRGGSPAASRLRNADRKKIE